MSHYDTLGVARHATPAQIKRAYQRLSKKHHPDRKGGDAEEMKRVNVAFETLIDPERRASYDAAGDQPAQSSIDDEGTALLKTFFAAAIDNIDSNWLQSVDVMLVAHEQLAIETHRGATDRLNGLRSKRHRIKVKSGDNLVRQIIDEKIAAQQQTIANASRTLLVSKAAKEQFTSYEVDDGDLPRELSIQAPEVKRLQ